MVATVTLIFTVVSTPFWFFQASVLIFLFYCRYRGVGTYSTTFFLLFTMLSIIDSISQITTFLGMRIHAFFDFVHPFYLSSPVYSSVLYLCSAYFLYTQCILHLFIAINRIWNVYSILHSPSYKFVYLGNVIITLSPCFAVLLLIPRFFYVAMYFKNADGSLSLKYTDTMIQRYQSTVATSLIFVTAVPTFIIQLITVKKYQTFFEGHQVSMSKKHLQEYRLLCKPSNGRDCSPTYLLCHAVHGLHLDGHE
uniref:Serpentine receptor class gamma n=1 Tax=Panagrellus redivivus TaxID=6233 RepID=A0A7E4V1E0_PANRE